VNDDDLRNCFAMFAMAGAIMRGESWTPRQIWGVADDMVEARRPEPEEGIVAIKKRVRKS